MERPRRRPLARGRGTLTARRGRHPLVHAARQAGVADERVLAAIAAVPRADFVPPDRVADAERDVPVRIARGQVTTQPSLVARMVEALALSGADAVLEVGAALGYQTALLARLPGWVWAVERWPDLAAAARANLAHRRVANVDVVVADDTLGLPEAAPFDAVVVAAAFPAVPPPLVEQLAPDGRCVQPIGPGGSEEVVLFVRTGGGVERRRVISGAHFVKLYGRHGFR